MRSLQLGLSGALAAALAGCAHEPAPAPSLVAPSAGAPPAPILVQALEVRPHLDSGVVVADVQCTAGAEERCNALDDDCDGAIDEGCGYATGTLQVTLGWNTGADVDLYVTDPGGETIMYKPPHRSSASGGVMDQDARGNCRPEQAHSHVENVYWATDKPHSGQYRVEVAYWGPCGDAAETQTTVSIAVGGRVLGVYGYALHPEERATVATFTLR